MMGLLYDAHRALVRDFVEQEDKKILFSFWLEEQSAKVKNAGLTINEEIMKFIFDVWTHGGVGENSSEVIRRLFHDGYCYYFALMLKDAFPGGKIQWARPYGHIVFTYDDVPYDIEGVYFGEGDLVDYEELRDTLEPFRHRGRDDELNEEIDRFAEEHGMTIDELVDKIYAMIPEDQKIKEEVSFCDVKTGDVMRFFREYKEFI